MYIYMQGAAICHSESGPNICRFVCLPVCVSTHLNYLLGGPTSVIIMLPNIPLREVVSPNPTPCEAPATRVG